jgi:acyl-CoA synthetase (NDP forming)
LLEYARLLVEGAKTSAKPFYFMTTRSGVFRRDQLALLREAGITIVGGTRQGLGALDRLARWNTPLPPRRPTAVPSGRVTAMLARGARSTVHEGDAKTLLAAAGVPVVGERQVTTLDEARAAAKTLGFPVVLKVVSDTIPHRSDLGLVAVGLRDDLALTAAWSRMWQRLDQIGPSVPTTFLVQEMVGDGVEVFAGVSRDPDFGLVLAFGGGGVLIEALDDVALRTLPLREGDAAAMIGETRVATLLAGFRGRPPADTSALVTTLEAIADFAWAERDRIDEIDVNPIMVRAQGEGCVVVDALIVPRRGQPGAQT